MPDSIAHIGGILKAAREQKGLSQRAFGLKIGVPQSYLSKIENGTIDLQLSSLLEISRGLDLEPMLVPRKLIPTLLALMQENPKESSRQIPKYRLDEEEEDV